MGARRGNRAQVEESSEVDESACFVDAGVTRLSKRRLPA
jgi:hypothetical protein